MTKKEIINRNIGLAFDFIRQAIDEPSLLDKLPDGSVLEFVEKDFLREEVNDSPKKKSKRKYLRVNSHFSVIDDEELFKIDIKKALDDKMKAIKNIEKKTFRDN